MMSAIASILTPDTPHPSRASAAKPHAAVPAIPGQPTRFADFLKAAPRDVLQTDGKAAPSHAKASADSDAEQEGNTASTSDMTAILPGNVLPTTADPLPVAPDIALLAVPVAQPAVERDTASAPASAVSGAANIERLAMTATRTDQRMAWSSITPDAAPRVVDASQPTPTAMPATLPGTQLGALPGALPDASPTAQPTIDPKLLDTLHQATTSAAGRTMIEGEELTAPGFRLVAATPNGKDGNATTTPAPVTMPDMPSGPLTVVQPAQSAATIGLLAGALRGFSTTPDKDEDRRETTVPALTAGLDPAVLAATDPTRPVVAAGAADQAPLDMTQQQWPQSMIDRIDRMREDAATASTRIQLSPDALGGIQVAIRHDDGGATHLQFTADQARTATMLADAHATLSHLAEDRGMRLGDIAVATSGTAGSDMGQSNMGQSMRDQRPPAQSAPAMPTRPRGGDPLSSGEDPTAIADASPATLSTRIA